MIGIQLLLGWIPRLLQVVVHLRLVDGGDCGVGVRVGGQQRPLGGGKQLPGLRRGTRRRPGPACADRTGSAPPARPRRSACGARRAPRLPSWRGRSDSPCRSACAGPTRWRQAPERRRQRSDMTGRVIVGVHDHTFEEQRGTSPERVATGWFCQVGWVAQAGPAGVTPSADRAAPRRLLPLAARVPSTVPRDPPRSSKSPCTS